MKAASFVLLLFIAVAAVARADTVVLRKNGSFNGTITSLTGSQVILQAEFPDKTQTLTFSRSDVLYIEFNRNHINRPAVPAMGGHEQQNANTDNGKPSGPALPPSGDLLIFMGGQQVPCNPALAGGGSVSCNKQTFLFTQVWRIYLQ